MMTKSYLFAALTSTLLLVLVVPLLKDSWWMPTELVSIAVLSVISIAVGGLSAEIYVIVRGRKAATDLSGTNTRKYFMSLISSLLFLTIVAPSIQSMIDSASVVDAATIAFLLILSLALAGLTAQGFFAILSQKATRKNVDCKNVLGATPDASVDSSSKSLGSSSQVGAEIDSRFNAIDATLDKRMQELKQQLLDAIHDIGQAVSVDKETNTKGASTSVPSPAKTEQVKHQQDIPTKDQVVDALLGKAKVSGI